MKIGFNSSNRVDTLPKDVAEISLTLEKDSQVLVMPSGRKSIAVGMGEAKDFNLRKLIVLIRKIISLAKANKIKRLAISFSDFDFPNLRVKDGEVAQFLAENFEMANFEFVKYKSKPKEGWDFVREVFVLGKVSVAVKKGFAKGELIGKWVNECRSLANTPGGEMTPKILAARAKELAHGTAVKVKVLGLKEIKKLKMGGVIGVSRGSQEEPKFIILEYLKGGKKKPIVLVGKGVTFDTGGLNVKPEDHMYEMHMDMSGGAAVICSTVLAAKLKLKRNIVGLIPAVENMPSGSSYRPGDILRTMSGKTIEVLDTDAEGRVILSDALTYAKKYKPKLVVDIATLTGASMVALGQRASAIFTKDVKLENLFRELGEKSGDYVWPLPLWDEYEEDIKGTFGDVANLGKTKYGGAVTGAMFLYQFAKDYPWVHIDMAPRMTSVEGENLAKGAAGAPVRLLVKLLEEF